jgi:hypothetical protein
VRVRGTSSDLFCIGDPTESPEHVSAALITFKHTSFPKVQSMLIPNGAGGGYCRVLGTIDADGAMVAYASWNQIEVNQ